MTAFDIQAPTRVCAATGRALLVGERFWAVLTEREGKIVRSDFSASAWTEPPADAIAYWTGTVPAADKPKKPIIHDDLLMDCLLRMDGSDPAKQKFRYVVALLLMRRKRLKFEDAGPDDLLLRDSKTGEKIRIADPRLGETEIETVQDEVMTALGWN